MAGDETVHKPVTLLLDQTSLLVGHLQPVTLLALLFIFCGRLVKDPAAVLLALAPTVAIVQAIYCICCLPAPGQAVPKAGSKKKASKPAQDLGARLVPAFLSFVLTLTLSAPLLYITVILFGAPLVSNHVQTLLLAVHLALLTTPPLFYAHGLDAAVWMRIASLQQPVDEIYGQALGALAGAWVGAIPIPLDWDREWQKWPVTIICGMYMGAVVGKLAGGYLFHGAKMKIN